MSSLAVRNSYQMQKAYAFDFVAKGNAPLTIMRQVRGAFRQFLLGELCPLLKQFWDLPYWHEHFFQATVAPFGPQHRTRQAFVLQFLGQNNFRFIYTGSENQAIELLAVFAKRLESYLKFCPYFELIKLFEIPLQVKASSITPAFIEVEFLTPVILDEIQNNPQYFTMEVFCNAVFRNLSDELDIYLDNSLAVIARQTPLLYKSLSRIKIGDDSDISKTKKVQYHGIVGSFTLPKEAWPLLSYLQVGQTLSIGKKRNMGFGSFQVFLLNNKQ